MKEVFGGKQKMWLVTGCAGFIGSHLVIALLRNGQKVRGLDNFATGKRENLSAIEAECPAEIGNFHFIEGDIRNVETCAEAAAGVEIVLHQAALGSVPRSIARPLDTHDSNVTGFANMLYAAKEAGVRRFVYASSSSVYGDAPELPKREDRIGEALSPYAVSKYTNELYAKVFARNYPIETVGLRYFNVFGPRQDPSGAYAAVIPRWLKSLFDGRPCEINGDGSTSRDFCFIDNVVQANIRAGLVTNPAALNQAYNIAVGDRTTLLQLLELLRDGVRTVAGIETPDPVFKDFRTGDVQHSLANIDKAVELLGYKPQVNVRQGIERLVSWASSEESFARTAAA